MQQKHSFILQALRFAILTLRITWHRATKNTEPALEVSGFGHQPRHEAQSICTLQPTRSIPRRTIGDKNTGSLSPDAVQKIFERGWDVSCGCSCAYVPSSWNMLVHGAPTTILENTIRLNLGEKAFQIIENVACGPVIG